jgi:hypothetical protein
MTYTGHKKATMPDGKSVVDWLRVTVDDECNFYKVPKLTDEQIAIVVSSMRMHHLMMHAAEYDYSELGQPDKKQEYWPMQSSIGRFFRDAARVTLDKWQMKSK